MAENTFVDPGLHIRPAVAGDVHALVELVNFAGEGMPLYLWERMAEEGESGWECGRRRARREEGDFSYRNAIVAETEGEVAACMIGYAIPDEPGEIDTDTMPAMFVPLQELENLAAGSWYTDILAVYPQFRGRGFGTILLDVSRSEERRVGTQCRSRWSPYH